ncbi:Hypothetical predicted protein, partial [Marmota monax]
MLPAAARDHESTKTTPACPGRPHRAGDSTSPPSPAFSLRLCDVTKRYGAEDLPRLLWCAERRQPRMPLRGSSSDSPGIA